MEVMNGNHVRKVNINGQNRVLVRQVKALNRKHLDMATKKQVKIIEIRRNPLTEEIGKSNYQINGKSSAEGSK